MNEMRAKLALMILGQKDQNIKDLRSLSEQDTNTQRCVCYARARLEKDRNTARAWSALGGAL